MFTCNATFAPWVLWLITIGTAERVRLDYVVDKSQQIEVGSTKAEVRAMLGTPDGDYEAQEGFLFFWGPTPQRWMYGTTLDLKFVVVPELPFPNPIPINLRIFGFDEDDMVISWNAEGKVAKIVRPELDVPDGAHGVCEFFNVVRVWGREVRERVGR